MSAPDVGDAEAVAVSRVLETAYLSMGSQLPEFERTFADYVGARHAVGVNSGTSGLHLAVIAAGVEAGDFVITTPFTFVASANCVLYERAIPVFVDVDPQTGNIDPELAAEAARDIMRGPQHAKRWLPPAARDSIGSGQLRALLPVHVFGQPAEMRPLLEVARSHQIAIIEDACEAIGATYQGRSAGTMGDAAVFGFYPNKQVTTGEGGMIVTDNPDWADLFRSLRNQGRDSAGGWLCHERLGYNYRLDEMSAAMGLVQTERLDEILANRARVADWYNQRLAPLELIERPQITATTTRMSWFVYVIRLKPPANRDLVMRELEAAGIPTRIYFPPVHLQPLYRERFGYERGAFPSSEHLGDISLALPFSGVMTESDVDCVCERLSRAITTTTQSTGGAGRHPDRPQMSQEQGAHLRPRKASGAIEALGS